MKAQIVNISPQVAENYLKANKNNRTVDERKVSFYTSQMELGEWVENGESIIIDINGDLKDGQHRLLSIIKAKKTFRIPVITQVATNVMATIDTGKNRSIADILHLEGFKYPSPMASLSCAILKYKRTKSFGIGKESYRINSTGVSNQQALEFCLKYQEALYTLIQTAQRLASKSPYKVLTNGKIAFILYILGGFEFSETHTSFMKNLLGTISNEGNACRYVHKRLYESKMNGDSLNTQWVFGMIIKAWNLFIEGDPTVNYIKYNIKSALPKIKTI